MPEWSENQKIFIGLLIQLFLCLAKNSQFIWPHCQRNTTPRKAKLNVCMKHVEGQENCNKLNAK